MKQGDIVIVNFAGVTGVKRRPHKASDHESDTYANYFACIQARATLKKVRDSRKYQIRGQIFT